MGILAYAYAEEGRWKAAYPLLRRALAGRPRDGRSMALRTTPRGGAAEAGHSGQGPRDDARTGYGAVRGETQAMEAFQRRSPSTREREGEPRGVRRGTARGAEIGVAALETQRRPGATSGRPGSGVPGTRKRSRERPIDPANLNATTISPARRRWRSRTPPSSVLSAWLPERACATTRSASCRKDPRFDRQLIEWTGRRRSAGKGISPRSGGRAPASVTRSDGTTRTHCLSSPGARGA
jgi:hypothetical protein